MGDVRGIRVEFIITCRGVVAVAPVNFYRSYCGKDVSGSGDRIPCPKLKARGLGRDRGGRGCGGAWDVVFECEVCLVRLGIWKLRVVMA